MATPDHPVLDALARRASSRDFTDAPVPPALLDHVLDAAVRAPTAFNFQPYSLVVVRDPARRATLARIAGGQRHVAAPVCVVFCADTRRIERLCGLPGQLVPEEHPDAMITAVIDTSGRDVRHARRAGAGSARRSTTTWRLDVACRAALLVLWDGDWHGLTELRRAAGEKAWPDVAGFLSDLVDKGLVSAGPDR